jgi:hypothetical protein
MRQVSNWQKSVTIPTLLLSALTAFVPPSTAASTATTQEIQTKKITSFQNESVYQLAQTSDNCREVAARNGLYVREEPTVYSRALGIIPHGRNVTVVENPGRNMVVGNPGVKWMPISAPCKVMCMRVFSHLVRSLLLQKTAAKLLQGVVFMFGKTHQSTAILSE